jgi:hypothetical protein
MTRSGKTIKIIGVFLLPAVMAFGLISCGGGQKSDGADFNVTTKGNFEVTAKLIEIKGDMPDDPLYDYAFVFKYQVLQVHRGKIDGDVIYVGQYKPLKPREGLADARSGEIGGNLKQFRAGDVHRMALETPIEDYFMGGIVNRYFEIYTGPVYWAVWTNEVQ